MREFNAFRALPNNSVERNIAERGIGARIVASYRDERHFDGDRRFGYGGLVDDGRWSKVAEDMMVEYNLFRGDPICQLGFEKGFLLRQFFRRGLQVAGVETSEFALRSVQFGFVRRGFYWQTGFRDMNFEVVIAPGVVYCHNLAGAIAIIREVQRIGRRAFITLASFDAPEHESIMRSWSLLACTVLSKSDWLAVLRHCGYTGDYWFVTPRTLGLIE